MRIFLSYHTADALKAEALKAALEAKLPGSEVFVAHKALRHGAPWQPQLYAQILASDAFIILAGSKIGPWQYPEWYTAHDRSVTEPGFKLVPVLTADETPGLPFITSIQYIKAADPASEPYLSDIVAALRGEAPGTQSEPLWKSINPYRGLESLREGDADYFFGREAETSDALNLLAWPVNGIVTLIGNSGVGKSSLAEAGVFASLRRQKMPNGAPWPHALADSREWALITMRPGDDPVHALVCAFMDMWVEDKTDPHRARRRNEWVRMLGAGEVHLRDLIQATYDHFEATYGALENSNLPNAPKRILLNINQAEELYSLAPETSRAAFSRIVAHALTDRRFAVIASIRSDYYGYHQGNAPLFDHMHRLDVRPFDAKRLKRVITGPAEVLGASFESGELADFIVKGAAGQPGALPLLAFYMTDLWERMQKRGDGLLRLAEKTEMVDVGRALTDQAGRFLTQHPAEIDAIKRLFTLKLARVHGEGKAVRRRVFRDRLDDAEWRLIEALSDPHWRLVTTGEDSAGGAYAEVAHEVLLQSWGTLVAWLEGERGFLAFKAQVEHAQAAWLGAGRDKRALLGGLALIQAEQWLATRGRDFDAAEAAFIRESVAARDAELAAAERLRRRVRWGTAFFVALVATFAVFAGLQWQRADREKAHAVQEATRAEQEKSHAEQEFARAEKALKATAGAVDALVFDLAQDLKGMMGVQAQTIGKILKRARQVTEELASSGIMTPDLERNRFAALNESVDNLLAAGNVEEAMAAARESAAIMERLAKLELSNTGRMNDLSVSYEKIGNVFRAAGDRQGALEFYKKSLAISEKLAKSDEARADWQRDLSVSYNKIGDTLSDAGDGPGALEFYKKSLAISEKLAKSDEARADWQRDVAIGLERIGRAAMASGEGAAAVEPLERALAICQRLMEKHPDDLEARLISVVPHALLAELKEDEKIAHLEAALAILRPLAAEKRLDARRAGWVEPLERQLREAKALAPLKPLLAAVQAAAGVKDYVKAAGLAVELVQAVEKIEVAGGGKERPRTASALGNASWYQLFAQQFEAALASSGRAMELQPDDLAAATNYAHALMFLGQVEEARAVYLKHRGQQVGGGHGSWEDTVREDFAALEKAGLKAALMDEIRAAFAAAPEGGARPAGDGGGR